MRLHDRLDAARRTVDHLAHDTLALDKLPLDKFPVEQLRSVPDHLRAVPEQLSGHLPSGLPRRVRRRLPRRMRAALPSRRRMTTGRWVFVMSVVLAVALYMSLRRLAERVDGALVRHEPRTPDSGPAPAPAGRVPTSGTAGTSGTTASSAPASEDATVEAPLLDA
jgi:hypothetical protein